MLPFKETEMRLPTGFVEGHGDGFTGGVERAFMSTTRNPAVALDYSGGAETRGSILVIDFELGSRGAAIQWLSQYPHEEELLFPPCTGLSVVDVTQIEAKRCLLVSVNVSTARPNTAEVLTPQSIPGTTGALSWVGRYT